MRTFIACLLATVAMSACDPGTAVLPSPTPPVRSVQTSPLAATPDDEPRGETDGAQDCSTSGEHPTRTLLEDLVDGLNTGESDRVRSLFSVHVEDLWDPTSIPQTGTPRPTVDQWVRAADDVEEQFVLDEACVYRVGGATGVLSRTSKALVEAGLDDGVTQNFKVQVVNEKVQRLVIHPPDQWDELCEHFADEMARADAPRC